LNLQLNPKENYGQIYIRTNDINNLYLILIDNKTEIHPLKTTKPWVKEFALFDPDSNFAYI
jgi:hypothetical protein